MTRRYTHPPASSTNTRERMEAQPRRDTTPEILLRRELHRRGLRYRIDRKPVQSLHRRADIVFGPARVAVFVDGCFWHLCPEHGTWPRSNAAWWRDKLARNRERDRETDRKLAEAHWTVVRVWEHESPIEAADRVQEIVAARRP